jgi:hypothetical protein
MRISFSTYADGDKSVVETTNDGDFIEQLDGSRKMGERLSVYVELICEDNVKGADRVLDALAWLAKEVERRKKEFADEKKNKKAAMKILK